MDFGTILNKASKNDSQKKEVRYYSTKFEPPKKEQREKKSLSANIQKFLARKEVEEKQKCEEVRQRRDQLLELRSKDKKAVRRVTVMLKRTKSANQSVLDDAIDSNNTAVTLAGPSQPDEDDYGYVSQSAADYYNKMMDKYSKMPDEPKFKMEKKRVSTNLSGTKDRVKAALEREKEEALLPHKRKRRHKESTDVNDGPEEREEQEPQEKKKEKPKPRPNMPPPMNFSELLKMAEKKQFEPILIEVKEEKEERLFTKKQRREADKEREYLQQKEARKANANKPASQNPVPTKPNDVNLSKPIMTKNIPHSNDNRPGYSKLANDRPGPSSTSQLNKRPDGPNIPNRNPSYQIINERQLSENQNYGLPKRNLDQYSSSKGGLAKYPKPLQQNIKSTEKPSSVKNPSQSPSGSKQMSSNFKTIPSKHALSTKDFPPKDIKLFVFKEGTSKQLAPNNVQNFPKKDVKKNPNPRRIYDDEDEEYDSEMDDFIDDGEVEEDVSRHIKEIFGYDKRKYSRTDDDCNNMESSFAQQMREEVISTKIAIKEDLDDMKLEEELKKRKAMMKKRR